MDRTNTQPTQPTVRAGRVLPPGPPGLPLLGHMLAARRDPFAFVLDLARQHGDVVRYRFAHKTDHLISHPDGVAHVLQRNHRN